MPLAALIEMPIRDLNSNRPVFVGLAPVPPPPALGRRTPSPFRRGYGIRHALLFLAVLLLGHSGALPARAAQAPLLRPLSDSDQMATRGSGCQPHRQPRRDRVPGDPHRAAARDPHGRGLFRRRRQGAARAHGGRGGAHRAEPGAGSYLRGDRIIEAAKATGAEAIHPGYGFLSENADFAQAVIDAGLIWVGPKPDSIRAMGLKDAAKKLMAEAGVPVTPGYLGEDQDPKRLKKEAGAIGYPVLIKAVAGGGGKGMRKVDARRGVRRRARQLQARGASRVRRRPRADRKMDPLAAPHRGAGVRRQPRQRRPSVRARLLAPAPPPEGDRGSPAPGMDAETREAVCGAAVRAAQAVGYVGAGTIEFIADASEGLRADRIWFMEMNTRLQVEHPVTEEITGQDLVEWQLRVASGEPLPKTQDELSITGHAIEARLYAEDPAKGFLPSVDNLLISALTHNPQPLHLDETYAEATEFGRIVVNGTFTFALLVGLSVGDTTLGTLVANLGYDKVRMPKPVFIGDTLRAETEVVGLKDSNSGPRPASSPSSIACTMSGTNWSA
jgi:hypothetical protein